MKEHQLRNGIIATIVGGIALSFWPPFKAYIAETFWWLWNGIKQIWAWVFTSHDVHGWVLLVLIALAIPSVIHLFLKVFSKEEDNLENYYLSDQLFGAEWHWTFQNGSIENLWCLCPSCRGELVYQEFEPDMFDPTHINLERKTNFICEKCGVTRCTLKGDKHYALQFMKREIRRKIRSGEWQDLKTTD